MVESMNEITYESITNLKAREGTNMREIKIDRILLIITEAEGSIKSGDKYSLKLRVIEMENSTEDIVLIMSGTKPSHLPLIQRIGDILYITNLILYLREENIYIEWEVASDSQWKLYRGFRSTIMLTPSINLDHPKLLPLQVYIPKEVHNLLHPLPSVVRIYQEFIYHLFINNIYYKFVPNFQDMLFTYVQNTIQGGEIKERNYVNVICKIKDMEKDRRGKIKLILVDNTHESYLILNSASIKNKGIHSNLKITNTIRLIKVCFTEPPSLQPPQVKSIRDQDLIDELMTDEPPKPLKSTINLESLLPPHYISLVDDSNIQKIPSSTKCSRSFTKNLEVFLKDKSMDQLITLEQLKCGVGGKVVSGIRHANRKDWTMKGLKEVVTGKEIYNRVKFLVHGVYPQKVEDWYKLYCIKCQLLIKENDKIEAPTICTICGSNLEYILLIKLIIKDFHDIMSEDRFCIVIDGVHSNDPLYPPFKGVCPCNLYKNPVIRDLLVKYKNLITNSDAIIDGMVCRIGDIHRPHYYSLVNTQISFDFLNLGKK